MSSLFNDGCGCGGGDVQGTSRGKTKCKGCVCEVLNNLANRSTMDFCNGGTNNMFFIVPKGANEPLNLDPGAPPTEFELVSFDPNTCCAKFTFETTGQRRDSLIIDCRSIAGLVCVTDRMGGGLPPV